MQVDSKYVKKMTSVILAIGEALLHIRYIQSDLAKSLTKGNKKWENKCHLSKESQQEIQWWKKFLIMKNGLPIHKPNAPEPKVIIHVDASDIGWGVHSKLIQTTGYWTEEEKESSINVRELKTIYLAHYGH